MKFFVIGDSETVLGFRLVGVEGRVVETEQETAEALDAVFESEEVGIVIIPERIAEQAREKVNRFVYKTTFPLIIEIPDRNGPMEGRGSVRDMIRAAVGVHI